MRYLKIVLILIALISFSGCGGSNTTKQKANEIIKDCKVVNPINGKCID